MQLAEDERKPLDNPNDFDAIDAHLQQFVTLPSEALILDEDMPTMPLIKELRNRNLRFKGGRGAMGKYKRVEIIHAGHVFDTTTDRALLEWCHRHEYILLTCNVVDFQKLDQKLNHSGIIISTDQKYPAKSPYSFSRKCDAIFTQYRKRQFNNSLFAIRP